MSVFAPGLSLAQLQAEASSPAELSALLAAITANNASKADVAVPAGTVRQFNSPQDVPAGWTRVSGPVVTLPGGRNVFPMGNAPLTFSGSGTYPQGIEASALVKRGNGELRLIGGIKASSANGEGLYAGLNQAYVAATDTWSTRTGAAVFGHARAVEGLDGNVYCFGGSYAATGGAFSARLAVSAPANMLNPTTEVWTGKASMAPPRYLHTAELLPSGKMHICGGIGAPGYATTYDPAVGTYSDTGAALPIQMWAHLSCRLADGKILYTGGWTAGNVNNTAAYIYDEATGAFTLLASPLPLTSYTGFAALRADGKVLLSRGGNGTELMLFDPATLTFSVLVDTLPFVRYWAGAQFLADGSLLIVGGTVPGVREPEFDAFIYAPDYTPAGIVYAKKN